MVRWFEEFLVVLSYSKRTQLAIVLGITLFIGIHVLGYFVLSNFELQGPHRGLESVIVEKLAKKYDKAALVVLVLFLLEAVRSYRRARRRFFE